jgi:serine/threonine protein kinase
MSFDTPKREKFLKRTTKFYHDENNSSSNNDSILGRGAYGIVFKAIYRSRKVAVKVIARKDYHKYLSLKRESNILNFDHENIIKMLKIVDTKDHGALIMERFDNAKSLQFILDNSVNQKIDLYHRLKILRDISCGLKFCHKNSIIHNDLKPDNIMVVVHADESYVCKLFDFGCSYKIIKNQENYSAVVGTIRYSSPEVLQGLLPLKSSDIFALAIIMWQLKENEIPYASIKSNDVITWQVVKNHLRPDSTLLLLNGLRPENDFNYKMKRQHSKSDLMLQDIRNVRNEPQTPVMHKRLIKNSSRTDFRKKHDISLRKCKCCVKLSQAIQKIDIRKNLFDFKSLDLSNDSNDEDEDYDENSGTSIISLNLFIDKHLHLRARDKLIHVENEYIKLYKSCWHENQSLRPSILRVCSFIQKHFDCLQFNT